MPTFSRLDEVVSTWAALQPDACIATFGRERYSYRDFNDRIEQLAGALHACGVGRGDRVAVLQTSRPEFLVTLLAVSSLGAIWVGLNPKYQIGELVAVVADCQPKLLIARSRALGRDYTQEIKAIRKVSPQLETVVIFDGDPALADSLSMSDFVRDPTVSADRLQSIRAAAGGDDPCILVYTSGSTGRPKGALLSHSGILSFCQMQDQIWPVRPHKCLNYFPINHVGCVVDISMPCLVAGGAIVFLESFDASQTVRLVAEEAIRFLGSVPSVYQMQLAAPEFANSDWSCVDLLVWEGAAMPEEVIQRLMLLGCPMATNYNMTEASAITVLEPTRDIQLLSSTVGSAYPGVAIRLMNESGAEAAINEPGEVWVKSRSNCLGYWNQTQATLDAFSADGFFRTGDLAIRRSDGRYRLVGRIKEMFKSGGYNVYPREVEAVIEAHPSVAAAVVVPKPDPLWQEVGVAFVVPEPGKSVDSLAEWVSERLANYKRPKSFIIRDSLPLLPIGKVDRAALRRQVLENEPNRGDEP